MASRYALILLLVVLIGCRPATPPPTSVWQIQVTPNAEFTPSPATPTTPSEVVQEIRNTPYQLGAADTLQVVQLTDGRFEQGTPGSDDFMSVMMTDFVAVGDLSHDGTDEAVALVSENYGGTGVFVFLVVYSQTDGTWRFETSNMVDDRPQLNAISIANGEIFLDVVIHGIDEPMCCPTLRTTRHYRFADTLLDLIDYTTFTPAGEPRTIMIESPADGSEVFTSIPVQGGVAVAPFENNLVYRIYDISGIELSAGAINVSVPDPGAPGTFESVIPLGNILSGATIRLEVQDLSAADGSLLAMDSVELVVK
jgi:hypothetical protein